MATPQTPATATVSIIPTNVTDHAIAPGTRLKFNVSIANSPSLHGFDVWVWFDSRVLNASSDSINFAGNIMSGNPIFVESECINSRDGPDGGCGNNPNNGPGVVNLGVVFRGNFSTPQITNGLLFRITLTVNDPARSPGDSGATQLLLQKVVLASPNATAPAINSFTNDGYFTNRYCSANTLCSHPYANFTYSPRQPSINFNVTFNAATSKATNPSSQIKSYEWNWGGEVCKGVGTQVLVNETVVGGVITPPNATAGHEYCAPGKIDVTLRVTDTLGISWAIVQTIPIIYVFIDVAAQGINADPQHNVTPGTIVHITAGIVNNSTLPASGNITLVLDTRPPKVWNATFSLPPAGTIGSSNLKQLGPVPWDTKDAPVRAYRLTLTVTSNQVQNITSDKTAYTFVQLIVSQPSGSFSLNLLQSSGLGILVIFALVAGLSRFRRRPRWETEPLTPE